MAPLESGISLPGVIMSVHPSNALGRSNRVAVRLAQGSSDCYCPCIAETLLALFLISFLPSLKYHTPQITRSKWKSVNSAVPTHGVQEFSFQPRAIEPPMIRMFSGIHETELSRFLSRYQPTKESHDQVMKMTAKRNIICVERKLVMDRKLDSVLIHLQIAPGDHGWFPVGRQVIQGKASN